VQNEVGMNYKFDRTLKKRGNKLFSPRWHHSLNFERERQSNWHLYAAKKILLLVNGNQILLARSYFLSKDTPCNMSM